MKAGAERNPREGKIAGATGGRGRGFGGAMIVWLDVARRIEAARNSSVQLRLSRERFASVMTGVQDDDCPT
jgi:hypothetical protein